MLREQHIRNSNDLPLRASHNQCAVDGVNSMVAYFQFTIRVYSLRSPNAVRFVYCSKIGLDVFCRTKHVHVHSMARISHSHPTRHTIRYDVHSVANMHNFFSRNFILATESQTDRKWFIKWKTKKKKRKSAVVRGVVGVIPLHAWTEWIETIHWHEQEMESTWYAMIACPLFRLHILWIQPKCNRKAMILLDFPNVFFFSFCSFFGENKICMNRLDVEMNWTNA